MHDLPPTRSQRNLARLRTHHARLEAQLAHESRQPLPDSARLMSLKRRKLFLKDQIVRLHAG